MYVQSSHTAAATKALQPTRLNGYYTTRDPLVAGLRCETRINTRDTYIDIHIYTYIYTNTCIHICIHGTRICICVHIHIYIHTHRFICIYACILPMCAHAKYMCICVYTSVCMHTREGCLDRASCLDMHHSRYDWEAPVKRFRLSTRRQQETIRSLTSGETMPGSQGKHVLLFKLCWR